MIWPAETLVGPGVGTPLPVGTGGGPGYTGGSYGGPSTGPAYGAPPGFPSRHGAGTTPSHALGAYPCQDHVSAHDRPSRLGCPSREP